MGVDIARAALAGGDGHEGQIVDDCGGGQESVGRILMGKINRAAAQGHRVAERGFA
jgi:hypothetical protein